MWLICGFLLTLLAWTVDNDENKVKDTVRRHIYITNNDNSNSNSSNQNEVTHTDSSMVIYESVHSPLNNTSNFDSEIALTNDIMITTTTRSSSIENNSGVVNTNLKDNSGKPIKYLSLKQTVV